MLPEELQEKLERDIAAVDHPKELAVDVMFALQKHYGYLTDEAVETAADLLGIAPVEIEEIATFYTFVYREPAGKYVIHVCDSLLCMLDGSETIEDHLQRKLGIRAGETTDDGLFTLLPVCCIGYCDRAPAMLINRKVYGPLTVESLDAVIDRLKTEHTPTD